GAVAGRAPPSRWYQVLGFVCVGARGYDRPRMRRLLAAHHNACRARANNDRRADFIALCCLCCPFELLCGEVGGDVPLNGRAVGETLAEILREQAVDLAAHGDLAALAPLFQLRGLF